MSCLMLVSCNSQDKTLNQTKKSDENIVDKKNMDDSNPSTSLNKDLTTAPDTSSTSDNVTNNNLIAEKIYTEKSVAQKDIKIYVLGDDACKDKIAILGSIHGDEPHGKYIIENLISYIKDNPNIIHNKQILFIPAINPDGLAKNTRGNANKVDLNRNFPAKNWTSEDSHKKTRYYPGDKPASEPETQMLIKYIGNFNPELIINIHSPLKVINYDGINSEKAAKLMAKYNGYKTASDIGYSTPGSFGTYFGKEKNISVITLETDSNAVEDAWKENKESLLAVIKDFNKISQ